MFCEHWFAIHFLWPPSLVWCLHGLHTYLYTYLYWLILTYTYTDTYCHFCGCVREGCSVVIRCAESQMLLTQPFLVNKSLVPLLAATQIMFSQVQKGWYKNRNSLREISSADWVCPCCIRHSFMSKLYKEDKVITHNVLLFPTFSFQKTSDKFNNLSSIISKERVNSLLARWCWDVAVGECDVAMYPRCRRQIDDADSGRCPVAAAGLSQLPLSTLTFIILDPGWAELDYENI